MNEPARILETSLTPLTPPPRAEDWLKEPTAAVPEARWEIIRFCVEATRALGMPRSSGEIFGFVFSAPRPVSFEEIVGALGISKGSASQGLRYLRRIGALHVTYVARDRRDHFVAEPTLGRLFSGYFLENVTQYFASQGERLRHLRSQVVAEPAEENSHLPARLDLLADWLRQAGHALQAAAETFSPTAGRPSTLHP